MTKKIILVCSECNSRNYTIKKSGESKERFEIKKYCKKCNKYTIHKETK